ncbi:hypothetical protein JQX13_11435 [Archangium violaceum]|nr:hypothetical protein JQX13_11435 [Archangium violaceum]
MEVPVANTPNNDPRSNDQRSDTKNPNNPAFKQDRDNRSNQLNPNSDAHPSRKSGGGNSSSDNSRTDSSSNQTRR